MKIWRILGLILVSVLCLGSAECVDPSIQTSVTKDVTTNDSGIKINERFIVDVQGNFVANSTTHTIYFITDKVTKKKWLCVETCRGTTNMIEWNEKECEKSE